VDEHLAVLSGYSKAVNAQRKVTCFVTRGSGSSAELCVFWHTGSGIQVPAGTVEDSEIFEDGARREVFEETALPDLELASYLGAQVHDLRGVGIWGVVRREVELRVRPGTDAPKTRWKLGQSWYIDVVERVPGFARIVWAERDLESTDGIVFARFEGWVSEDDLYLEQERRFYHFRAPVDSPDKWQTVENGQYEFHLYWVPLSPKPTLIASTQAWLDQFYDALVAGVRAS